MTDETQEIEAPELDQDVAEEVEVEETDVGEGAPEDMGLVVEIGGDDEDEAAPDWVNQLRRENRELKKWRKEQEAKAAVEAAPGYEPLPPMPKAEDFDFDSEAHAAAVREWTLLEVEHKRREDEAKSVQEQAAQRWEAKQAAYEAGKEKLAAPDFDDAEAVVSEIFAKPFPGMNVADVRMGIIKSGAKDPNTLVYALGRNPDKAKELAAIDDPVEFAFALGELSGKMKVVRSGKAPAPEKRIGGGVAPGVTSTNDRTLERLRAEAEKTGDYTKVTQYRRQLKK